MKLNLWWWFAKSILWLLCFHLNLVLVTGSLWLDSCWDCEAWWVGRQLGTDIFLLLRRECYCCIKIVQEFWWTFYFQDRVLWGVYLDSAIKFCNSFVSRKVKPKLFPIIRFVVYMYMMTNPWLSYKLWWFLDQPPE